MQVLVRFWSSALITLWSMTVMVYSAQAQSVGAEIMKEGFAILDVPPSMWIVVCLLSFIGACAGTLQKLSKETDLSRWKLLVARDMVCGLLAGVLCFLITLTTAWNWALNAAMIPVAGYGGTAFLDWLLSKQMKSREA